MTRFGIRVGFAAVAASLFGQIATAEEMPIGYYAFMQTRVEKSMGWITDEGALLRIRETGFDCLYFDETAKSFSDIRTPVVKLEGSDRECPEISDFSFKKNSYEEYPIMWYPPLSVGLQLQSSPSLPKESPTIPNDVNILGIKVGSDTSAANAILAELGYQTVTGNKPTGIIDHFETVNGFNHEGKIFPNDLITVASFEGRVVAIARSWVYALNGFTTGEVLRALIQRHGTRFARDAVLYDTAGVRRAEGDTSITENCQRNYKLSSDYFMSMVLGYKRYMFSPSVECLGAGVYYELQSEESYRKDPIIEIDNADTLLHVAYDSSGLLEFQWNAQMFEFYRMRDIYFMGLIVSGKTAPKL